MATEAEIRVSVDKSVRATRVTVHGGPDQERKDVLVFVRINQPTENGDIERVWVHESPSETISLYLDD